MVDFPSVSLSGRWYRLIPSRFPPVDVYERLGEARVRSAAVKLENLTNPRLASRARMEAAPDSTPATSHRTQNWNHAPFAYTNPDGSFLLDAGRPALEMLETVEGAVAYFLVRRETFLAKTDEPPTHLDMRLLSTPVAGVFADLTHLSQDEIERQGRTMGQWLYDDGASGAVFRHPRHGGARTLSVFDGSVLGRTDQATHYRFSWDGQRIKTVYDFGTGDLLSRDQVVRPVAQSTAA